jgi:hypothetical protein
MKEAPVFPLESPYPLVVESLMLVKIIFPISISYYKEDFTMKSHRWPVAILFVMFGTVGHATTALCSQDQSYYHGQSGDDGFSLVCTIPDSIPFTL